MPRFEPSPAAVSYSGPSTMTSLPFHGPVWSGKWSTAFAQAIEQPYQQPSAIPCVKSFLYASELTLSMSLWRPNL